MVAVAIIDGAVTGAEVVPEAELDASVDPEVGVTESAAGETVAGAVAPGVDVAEEG